MLQSLKKIHRGDPEIHACISLDHNQVKIAHLSQMRILLRNFTTLLIKACHTAKFEINPSSVDPDIESYKILGHNQEKIAHLTQKKIFGEILLLMCTCQYMRHLVWCM